MGLIEVENVRKHFKVLKRQEGFFGALRDLFSHDYKYVKAVENISMSISTGEIVGFAGPNGAGKSTTIKMLTGVLKPTSGKLMVNGFNPYSQRQAYVKNIGVVFGQRTQLWWDIPVIESFKLLKSMYQIKNAVYEENMRLFSDLVRLDEFYSVPVRQLSLGQRMLCDITASFLHNPVILFLDEPTIGLDIANKAKIRSLIKHLNEIKKTTILLTSHDVGDMEDLCKRIILIDKGTIIYDAEKTKFNSIFGSFRTLQVELLDDSAQSIQGIISAQFPQDAIPQIEPKPFGWLDITINQEMVPLLDVLTAIMKLGGVKDVKIREVEMEHIITRIYEGGLHAPVH